MEWQSQGVEEGVQERPGTLGMNSIWTQLFCLPCPNVVSCSSVQLSLDPRVLILCYWLNDLLNSHRNLLV